MSLRGLPGVVFLFVLSMVEIKIYLWKFSLFRETILVVTFSYAEIIRDVMGTSILFLWMAEIEDVS